jgi:hypothetical protein
MYVDPNGTTSMAKGACVVLDLSLAMVRVRFHFAGCDDIGWRLRRGGAPRHGISLSLQPELRIIGGKKQSAI